MKELCFIDQIGSHYRLPIYSLMVKELHCDFIFSDLKSSVKTIDYKNFSGYRKSLHRVSLPGGLYYLKGARKEAAKYETVILAGAPHALHVWLILIWGKLAGRKICLWSHGWYGKEGFLKRIVKKFFFSMAHKVFLYGNRAKSLMVENGLPENKLCVISNSLDYDRHSEIRKRLQPSDIYQKHFNNFDPVLFFIGRIQKVKRIDLLVELLAKLVKKGEPCNLVIVGKDCEGVNLEALIEQYGLSDRVWLYGDSYDEEENARLIYNADMCISPGNVGLTAIHCLSYGCPVLTHNDFQHQMPEFEAVKEGVTGGFFKYNDLDDMVRCVEEWLKIVKERRAQVREACYAEIDSRWNPYSQIEVFKKCLK